MEQLLDALKRAQEKSIGDPREILDMVHEWKGMGENLLKSLVERVSEIESREKNLKSVGESIEKRLKDLEEREKRFKSLQERKMGTLGLNERALNPVLEDFSKEVKLKEEKLDEQLNSVREHIDSLEVARSEVEGIRLRECKKLKKIEKRKKEINCIRVSLEKLLEEVMEKEKEFDSFQDRKMKELALKEAALSNVEEMRLLESEKLKGIEKKEKEIASIHRSLEKRVKAVEKRERETDSIGRSSEKRLKEVEEREKEFESFQDRKMKELALKEAGLSNVEEMRLLESEKLKGIEKKEKDIDSICRSLEKRVKAVEKMERDIDSIGRSSEKRLKEVEEREKEFESFQDRKMKELALKEAALSNVEEMRLLESEKLKGIEKKENAIDSIHRSLEKRVKAVEKRERETDSIGRSSEKRLKEVEEREKEFESFQDRKMKELALKEAGLSNVEEMRLLESEKLKGIEKKEKDIDSICRSLEKRVKAVEKMERDIDSIGRSSEKRLKEVEEREKEFESFQDRKMKELALKEAALSNVEEMRLLESEKLKGIEKKENAIDSIHRSLEKRVKAVEKMEREMDSIGRSSEKRLKEVEEREKEFESLQDRTMRELALKEDLLCRKREELAKEVQLANVKFRDGEKLGQAYVQSLESALNMLDGMKVTIEERFKEIESWDTLAHESLNARINDAELIRESVEKRLREFEKMKRQFHSIQEEKMKKVASRERQLSIMRKDLDKEIKLMDDKLTEQQKLGNQLLECSEAMMARNLKEIESKELTLNVAREALDASTKEADLVRESANTRLKELEKMEEEFRLYQDKKTKKLVVEEDKLRSSKEKFIQEVKLRKEKLDKQEKLVQGLQEKLELAQKDVKDMNTLFTVKFKEIGIKENELNCVSDSIERKRNSLELKEKELLEKDKGIKAKEDSLISKENALEVKKKELQSKERKLEMMEKNVISAKEFIQTENLSEKNQQYECRLIELDSEEKQTDLEIKNLEVKPQQLTDARIEPETKMVRKTLEIFLSNTEKDLELMGDEAFKVLLLSSDPAKLVLDAMMEFYAPHLGKGDSEFKLWRTSTLLLDQLSKMSPKIEPCVREAAIRFATEWKRKMRNTAENPMELLGFLHLLAAYNLSSSFDKDDLLCFLKEVSHHKQTPELYRILGFVEDIPVLTQNLINEKQYLLASTYIHECELEHMFPQAAVLNYYVKHSKMLAKARCNRGFSSSEEQDKAIACEIADLQVAIDHIVKYGLENECSPDTLTAQIRQLDRDRATSKSGTRSSSGDPRMEDRNKRSQHRRDYKMKESAPDRNTQLPGEGSFLASNAQHPQSKPKKRPPITPVSVGANKRFTRSMKDRLG